MGKIIAITGGIGSGKSSVSKIIKSLGYKVFSADEVYSSLLLDKDSVKTIYNALNVTSDSYEFNRKLVADKVFSNKESLQKLNDITHPIIMKKMLELSSGEEVVFNEVPLLFEGGYEKFYDNVIIVIRDINSRVNSVALRDGLSKEEVLLRINNQYNYENKLNKAHTVIVDDGSLEELTSKVKVALEKII